MSHRHKPPPHVLNNIHNTFILESPLAEWGVFINYSVGALDVLGTLNGQVFFWADYKVLKSTLWSYTEVIWLDQDRLLVSLTPTKASLINHSPNPNCVLVMNQKGGFDLCSIQSIDYGSELTLNYNDVLNKKTQSLEMMNRVQLL